jgi:hypothetical protein
MIFGLFEKMSFSRPDPLLTVPLQVGGGFCGFGGRPVSPNDVAMSWLRLQQASDWITDPYWMYIKCFGTLICCLWAYGTTLRVIRLCRSEEDFGVLGIDLSPNDS